MNDIIEEEALTKLQEAWDSSEQKDECTVCLDDLERAYWMGTEVGLLGGYGFQGVTLGVDGSCKDGKMGSGCSQQRLVKTPSYCAIRRQFCVLLRNGWDKEEKRH